MKHFQQRMLAHLSGEQGDAYIQQSLGYGATDLVALIRMCKKAETSRLDARDVDSLCAMHAAVPRAEVQRRVDELNATPAGRGRMEAFVAGVTLGGPEAIERSLSLVDSFHQHDIAGAISDRLTQRQDQIDAHAGRTATDNVKPQPVQGSDIRQALVAAAYGGQRMPTEQQMAGRLADTIDQSRERLQADRDGTGDDSRSLRDTVADSFRMHEAGTVAIDQGLVEEPAP